MPSYSIAAWTCMQCRGLCQTLVLGTEEPGCQQPHPLPLNVFCAVHS